jgi:hypothetical protein
MLYTFTPEGQILGASVMPLPGVPATLTFPDGIVPQVDNGQVIAIEPQASQQLNVTLGEQACTIKLYFKQMAVPLEQEIVTLPPAYEPVESCFLDLYLNDQLVIGGVLVTDRNLIVRDIYFGFVGDLAMMDTQGAPASGGLIYSDPYIDGLGSRFLLTYWASLP